MKPDRFAQMARDMKYTRPFLEQNVAMLLRRQFSALRRLVVKQRYKRSVGINAVGYFTALDDVVKKIDAWKKGTP